MPQTKRRRNRKPSILSHACRVEALEDRRLLVIYLNGTSPYGSVQWTGSPVLLAPQATIDLPAGQVLQSMYVVAAPDFSPQFEHVQFNAQAIGGISLDHSVPAYLYLNGPATVASFQTVLRTLTFHNTDALNEHVFANSVAIGAPGTDAWAEVGVWAHVLSVTDATGTRVLMDDTTDAVEFTITLPFATMAAASVHYQTYDGTAVAGIDYQSTSGVASFNVGEKATTVRVPLLPGTRRFDGSADIDRFFTLELSDPTNAILTDESEVPFYRYWPFRASATGIIFDGLLTNPTADALAYYDTSAKFGDVSLSVSLETGDAVAIVRTITGPLSENAALVYSSATTNTPQAVSVVTTIPASPTGSSAYRASTGGVLGSSSLAYREDSYAQFLSPDYLDSSGIAVGTPIRIDAQLGYASNFETGTYTWQIVAAYSYSESVNPNPPLKAEADSFHGLRSVVNRYNSPYGTGRWIDGLDQLFIQDEDKFSNTSEAKQLLKPKGITYVRGSGVADFFAFNSSSGTYTSPKGFFGQLKVESNGYVLIEQDGTKKHFSGDGLMQSVNRGVDIVSYNYNGDKTVSQISDLAGHVIHFGYTSNKLTSITDANSRVTTVTPTSITAPPLGAGMPPLVTNMSGSGYGFNVTLPSGESVQTTASYLRAGELAYTYPVLDTAQLSVSNKPFVTEIERTAQTGPSPDILSSVTFNDSGWVTEYTDAKQNTTNYKRDESGLILEITLPGATEPQYVFTYDERGNMLTRTSKGTPGIGGQPDAIESWTYDPNWNLPNSYTDPYDQVTEYTIDSETGQVQLVHQQVFDEVGGEPTADLLTYFYYTEGGGGIPGGLVERVVGPNVVDTQYVETRYDYTIEGGNLVQTATEAYGTPRAIQRKSVYDRNTMNLVQYIDERGKTTEYQYNDLDQLRKVIEPSSDGALPNPVWEYTYDKGLLKTIIDPMTQVTKYDYVFGWALSDLKVTYPKPTPTANEPVQRRWYDTMGRMYSALEPINGTTNYFYDDNGNLDELKLPPVNGARPTTTYHYNAQNLLEWSRDPNQNVTNYEYDNRGQLTKVIEPADPAGVRPETRYFYDQRGLRTGVEDPLGRLTSYAYDSLGRLTQVTQPNPGGGQAASTTKYQYDNAGNVRFVTTGFGSAYAQTTENVYDELNRLTSVIEPAPQPGRPNPTTSYTYHATGELHTLTDPNGNTTTWEIDNLGRTTSESITLSGVVETRSYQYDAVGNLTRLTDRLGRITNYTYDALNRMTDEVWFQNDAMLQLNSPDRTLSYRYNLAGDLIAAFDPAADYVFQPDNLGRVTSTAVTITGLPGISLENLYDANGNRESLTASVGSTLDFINGYQYDALNRLTSIAQIGSAGDNNVAYKQVGFKYNLAGQLTNVNRFDEPSSNPTNPAGSLASSVYDYDGAGRLKSIDHTPALATAIQMSWVYDPQNRVQQFWNSADTPVQTFYGYDANNQLLGTTGGSPESYDYDAGGNRTSANGVTVVPDDWNRLSSDGRYSYLYDDEGNLTWRTETATGLTLLLEWDHRNRLTDVREWKSGESHVLYELEYEYDVFNRRVARKETTYEFADGGEGGSQVVGSDFVGEKYIYDGAHIVYDFMKIDEGDYELAKRYLYGPAVDQILAQENLSEDLEDADRVYWMLTDNQGTVRDIVNHDGALVEHYKYSAYGKLLDGDTSLTRYLYTGRELDATTGLQYNRARWYDSESGRFLSEDPIGFAGGDANLYRYIGNSPTNATDPSGLAEWVSPWDSSANWNVRDTLSFWTGGFLPNQAQYNEMGASGPAIGAAPNPAMVVDGIAAGFRRMGYGEEVDAVMNFLDPPLPEGIKIGMAPPLYGGRPHANSLSTNGIHDVYVVREIGSGRLLHFGETGRGYLSRFAEHQRAFDKLGIDIRVDLLKTVDGKAAARQLESRYIDTYRRTYGQRPPFNQSNH